MISSDAETSRIEVMNQGCLSKHVHDGVVFSEPRMPESPYMSEGTAQSVASFAFLRTHPKPENPENGDRRSPP